jgi:hypothetical protein
MLLDASTLVKVRPLGCKGEAGAISGPHALHAVWFLQTGGRRDVFADGEEMLRGFKSPFRTPWTVQNV